jgi:hypothetical protein
MATLLTSFVLVILSHASYTRTRQERILIACGSPLN